MFPIRFGRDRGGLAKKWFNLCDKAAKQPVGGAWHAEEVSFKASDHKLASFRPPDAWFVNNKGFKFLKQICAAKFKRKSHFFLVAYYRVPGSYS